MKNNNAETRGSKLIFITPKSMDPKSAINTPVVKYTINLCIGQAIIPKINPKIRAKRKGS